MVGIALPALAWDSLRLEAKGTDNLPNDINPCNPISKFFINRPNRWRSGRSAPTVPPVHVVVTGGTGFIGKALIRALFSEGWTPRLLLRESARHRSHRDLGIAKNCSEIEFRSVDFLNPRALKEACRGAAAVIHLVGIISELGQNTFESAHVDLTRRMVRATQDAGIRRYIQMSALGTRDHARSRYHQTKWAAEQLLRESGLDWTIFRPSLVYDANGGFTAVFDGLSRFSPVLPALGGGHGLMQPIGLEQVALAFARALRVPASVGHTYDLCGPERLEFRVILKAILAALGRRRWILPIPFPLARVQARILEFVWPRLLRRAPPLHRDQILMLEEDNIGDGTEADALFGLVHPPFREALIRQRQSGSA